ncbi:MULTISPECIES: tripartite tricarboxylate transporter substrate binding protein [Microbacterium]|uniref:tripartite tricarboxylate transporter substrate binding protein n=1 Tax=Microbacterium TaxID=33882 RepID=UPI00277F2B0B|nr:MULTISPECIES: tripartite tricarboxylate transporter substrate binding protein [Microbacterium]MDQ1082712.1 putative tricarboxylic transport membrane protein [Microbacterium sp. SORGH_AS_0344]MDQ1168517.1 putative tricarboxylic transport membrane protein [Microbacterium proteolyticum]
MKLTRIGLPVIGLSALALVGCGATAGTGGDSGPGSAVMIVPFSAGGGSDVSGRAIASGLEEAAGVNITTENREGGSGAVGYSYFLGQQGNEGILLASETALLALPLTQDVQFDYTSFTPIMKLGDDYTLLVVRDDSPFESCEQVVDTAESERVIAAVSGATSLDEIVFTLVEQDQDVTFDRVPYESGSEVLAGLLGGTVDVASLNPSEVLGQIESGDLRALCAFADDRYEYEALSDIPTASEQGIDVAFAQYRGFIAPGGISEEARQFWIDAAEEFATSDAYTEYIESNLMQPDAAYGDDFVAYLEGNNADLEAVLR